MKAESWKRIAEAQEFYETRGFRYLDVPWTVPKEISAITKPHFLKDFYIEDKVLVGSAEQSFLSIYDELDKGLYYAITPCFRDEVEDEWHQKNFMKLELFQKGWLHNYFISTALEYFSRYTNGLEIIEFDPTKREWNFDIELGGIEVGSYGIRSYADGKFEWTYGTGLAEPRFTKALWQNTQK